MVLRDISLSSLQHKRRYFGKSWGSNNIRPHKKKTLSQNIYFLSSAVGLSNVPVLQVQVGTKISMSAVPWVPMSGVFSVPADRHCF